MDIEVAPLISAYPAFAGPSDIVDNAGPDVSWDDRPKVVVQATLDTTIADLITEAGRKMRLEERPGTEPSSGGILGNHYLRVAFHGQGVGPAIVPLDAILKSDGSVDWYFNQHWVTVRQILVAAENGLFQGDPWRMYLILDDSTAGGGGIEHWLELLRALPYVEAYLTAHGLLAASVGTVRGFRTVVGRMRRMRAYDGSLKKYESLLAIPRTTQQIATLLQLNEQEVPAICHFFGMQFADGAWRPGNRPGASEYRELIAVVALVCEWELSEAVRKRAFAEILSMPVGERLKNVEATLRTLNYREAEGLD